MLHRAETESFDFSLHGGNENISAQPAEAAYKLKILCDCQFLINRRRFRQIANPAFHLHRLVRTIESRHPCDAFGGWQKTGQNAHGGGFTRPIGTEKCQYLALGDGEADTIESGMLSIPL